MKIYYIIIILVIIYLLCIYYKNIYEHLTNTTLTNTTLTNTTLTNNISSNKLCCIFAYYEKDEKYKTNLTYFLNNGILSNVDYYIVINGESTVDIPNNKNIIILKRPNLGFDFGAYSYALKQINKEYDYYFFINSSVRGPYLKLCNKKPWTQYFLELFKPNVKLVGTSINIYPLDIFSGYNLVNIYNKNGPFTHVQSMFFCMDNEYLKYLKEINFFNEEELNKINDIIIIIAYKEFGLSQLALKKGWNINSILPKYKDLNYLEIKNDINPSSIYGDPYHINGYFNSTIDKYDIIFYKNNRKGF